MQPAAGAAALFPERIRGYLLTALGAAPAVLARVVDGLTPGEADFRPDPDRFTIREAVAHLADWDEVFTGRIVKTLEEERPTLVGIDEGELAIARNYGQSDWTEQLRLFAERRAGLATLLRGLGSEDWLRAGVHTELGEVPVQLHLALVVAHDGYHMDQIVAWRSQYRAPA